jgi:hypothetical protein
MQIIFLGQARRFFVFMEQFGQPVKELQWYTIPKVRYQSVCPFVRIRSAHRLPASECVSPLDPKGEGQHSLAGEGETIRTTAEKTWHYVHSVGHKPNLCDPSGMRRTSCTWRTSTSWARPTSGGRTARPSVTTPSLQRLWRRLSTKFG